jgi:hypothetical protein
MYMPDPLIHVNESSLQISLFHYPATTLCNSSTVVIQHHPPPPNNLVYGSLTSKKEKEKGEEKRNLMLQFCFQFCVI